MSTTLVEAVIRACVTMSSAIEATIESTACQQHELANEIISEVQADLVEAYNLLTNQMSVDLNLDARKLIQDLIVADLESSRAILAAQTSLRFPVSVRE